MGQDLDDIDELLEDFTSELRQQNKSKGTIDTYSSDVKYFRKCLTSENLPPTLEFLTRQTLGAYIEHTLNRVNHRTQKPVTPRSRIGSTAACSSSASTSFGRNF
ncbi:site-specific integrase [Nocardia salmonicida]|uniref:site-specific integrase n=1 Tax=Nocardia salmonicida TaxID=53431 RepID=UPI0033C5FF28